MPLLSVRQNMNGGYADPMGNSSGTYGMPQQNLYQPPNMYQPPMMSTQMMQPPAASSLDQLSPAPQFSRSKPEPPPPKAPIPEEHVSLQTVFDDLRSRCFNSASNPVRHL